MTFLQCHCEEGADRVRLRHARRSIGHLPRGARARRTAPSLTKSRPRTPYQRTRHTVSFNADPEREMSITITTGTTSPTVVYIGAHDIAADRQQEYVWLQSTDGTPTSSNSLLIANVQTTH